MTDWKNNSQGCFKKNSTAIRIEVSLRSQKTNDRNVGFSKETIAVFMGRPLTSGEILICHKIFRDSVNYGNVKIFNLVETEAGAKAKREHKSPPVITDPVNPYIFFPPKETQSTGVHFYRDDFSKISDSTDIIRQSEALLIHEMTHVWQCSRAKFTLTDIRGVYDPRIGHIAGEDFSRFNHEQQAELLSWYYQYKYTDFGRDLIKRKESDHVEKLAFAEKSTLRFFKHPEDNTLIPKNAALSSPVENLVKSLSDSVIWGDF